MASPPEDLAAFCSRVHPRLVGALSLYVGDAGAAEELAQDALERVCQRWERIRQMDSPAGWAHQVAFNLAKSRFRRWAAERRALDRVKADEHSRPADHETRLAVRRAVAQLPEAQREAVVLRFFLGYTAREAGARMGRSEGAVQQLTFRAMTALRADFKVDDEEGKETSDVDA